MVTKHDGGRAQDDKGSATKKGRKEMAESLILSYKKFGYEMSAISLNVASLTHSLSIMVIEESE